jgi:gluconolactonase
VGQFSDGPVWHAGMGVLFFATPLGEGALFRMLPDGRVLKVRDGNRIAGTTPIGNTVNGAGELITVEAKRVVRSPAEGGEPTIIALNWSGGAPPPPSPDGGAPTGDGTFDTLNDVVARKDGTLYVTDPGYFATPTANRIYRIDPAGTVQVVEAFDDVPRPNGVALSPDEKTLYVGFAAPVQGTLPFIRKYIVNDDGTLGEWTKFIDVGPGDSSPDGLAVDKVGNVYVATRAGVEVYKSDGKAWGTIAIPEKPTGMSFGGDDMKTLFVTTEGVKIWQLKLKVTGISQ